MSDPVRNPEDKFKSYLMYPLEDHQQGDITKCPSYQVNCDITVTYVSHVVVVSQGSAALDDMEGQSPTLQNHKKGFARAGCSKLRDHKELDSSKC